VIKFAVARAPGLESRPELFARAGEAIEYFLCCICSGLEVALSGHARRVRRCPLSGKPDIEPTSPNDRV